MPGLTSSVLERKLYHEAGHAVAAHVLGGKAGCIRIGRIGRPSDCQYWPPPAADVKQWFLLTAMIELAGMAAEDVFAGGCDRASCRADLDLVDDSLDALKLGRSRRAVEQALIGATKALLRDNEALVHHLAKAVAQKPHCYQQDVQLALAEATRVWGAKGSSLAGPGWRAWLEAHVERKDAAAQAMR